MPPMVIHKGQRVQVNCSNDMPSFIAVCAYCLVMISIDLSEITKKKVHWKSETKSAIFFWTKFFSNGNFFPDKKILSEKNLGFCLRLNFVSDRICPRLNFATDYILQLHFMCNHLIKLQKSLKASSINMTEGSSSVYKAWVNLTTTAYSSLTCTRATYITWHLVSLDKLTLIHNVSCFLTRVFSMRGFT